MRLQALRQEVAHPRTSIQLCLLGIVGGVSAASLIIYESGSMMSGPFGFSCPYLACCVFCLLPISRALSTIEWVFPLLSTA